MNLAVGQKRSADHQLLNTAIHSECETSCGDCLNKLCDEQLALKFERLTGRGVVIITVRLACQLREALNARMICV
jgi:hypothetical protein